MASLIQSIVSNILNSTMVLIGLLVTALDSIIHFRQANKEITIMDIKKFRIKFLRSRVRNDLEEFKQHVIGVENYLSSEVKNRGDYHEKVTENYTEEEKNEYYDFYSDDYWELKKVFPSIQRKSELAGIYTVLEHNLNLLCSIYYIKTTPILELNYQI